MSDVADTAERSAPTWQSTAPGALSQWVIYRGARDVDARYLVRRWEIGHGAIAPCEAHGAASLEDARALLPPGLVSLGREPEDDPVIVETWT